MAEEYTQVNVNLLTEDAKKLDKISNSLGLDNRSALVRWLVRQEYERRFGMPVDSEEQSQPVQG